MKYIDGLTKFIINFLFALVMVVLFVVGLEHFAIAFIAIMLVLYTAEYAERKLTFNN